jgi:hypothetical protein
MNGKGIMNRELGLSANFAAKTVKRIFNAGVYMEMNPARFHTNRAGSVSISVAA